LLFVIVALLATPASAAKYLDATTPDLVRLLPPPPANDSPQTRSELDEVLQLQRERTPQDVEYARANIEIGVPQFAGALGDEAGLKQALPATVKALFDQARADEKKLLDAAKMHFDRPRPVALDARIQPCLEPIVNMAYPSGHATWVFMTAVLLADMVPERREAIWARAEDFARQRLVGGVHYRSDIDAGRIAGTVIAAFMLASPGYRADAAVATADLRNFLKLPPHGDVLPRRVASSAGAPPADVAVARDLHWFDTGVFAAPLAR
jgi:acid phosphatase (class A)